MEQKDNKLTYSIKFTEVYAKSAKELADKITNLEEQGVKVSSIVAVVLSISDVS